MSRARLLVPAASLLLAATAAGAQEPERGPGGAEIVTRPIVVRDVGAGPAGRILRDALRAPHLALHASERLVLPRDSVVPTTVIVLGGGPVAVASEVRGDVIVVGGDLFMNSGGHIHGRAIAIGGGVYESDLARIDGEALAFRDITYDAVTTEQGIALDYRVLVAPLEVPFVTLPAFRGLREPTYDRVNGLTLAVGPRFNFLRGRIFAEPIAAYRSDLGEVDPRLVLGARPGRRDSVSLVAERGTFSNDAWIRSDRWNSIIALATGKDTRNYFRADRAELRVHRRWEGDATVVQAFVGGRAEDAFGVGPHASDVGPGTGIESGPWSVVGREDDEEGMLRPNPRIDDGRTISALGGATMRWENQLGFELEALALAEQAFETPDGFDPFTQVTLDADLRFPTFGTQSFRFQAHAVFTGPDVAPRQRWVYLGGSGTLPTFDLLEFGGDELLFLESRYIVPIDRLTYPIFGPPVLTVRHMLGAAGPGTLPDLEQNVGIRLSWFLVRVDYTIEPVSGDGEFGFGVALSPR